MAFKSLERSLGDNGYTLVLLPVSQLLGQLPSSAWNNF